MSHPDSTNSDSFKDVVEEYPFPIQADQIDKLIRKTVDEDFNVAKFLSTGDECFFAEDYDVAITFRRVYASHGNGDYRCDPKLPFFNATKQLIVINVENEVKPSTFTFDWTTFSIKPVEGGKEVMTLSGKWTATFGDCPLKVSREVEVGGDPVT
jgi:hypothetical protein